MALFIQTGTDPTQASLSFVFALLRKLQVSDYQRYALDASASTYTTVIYSSVNEGMF